MEYKSNASRSKASSKKANSLKGLQRKSLQPWPTMFDLSYSCSMPVTPEPVKKRRLCLLKAILVIHGCILTKKRWHSCHWTWWYQYVDEGLNAWTAIFRAQLPRFWNHNSPPHDYPDWGRSAWETSPEQGGLLQAMPMCLSSWEVVSSIKHSDLAFKAKSTTTVSTWCLSLWLSARKSEIKKTPWELWRVKDEDKKKACMYIYNICTISSCN